MFDWFYDKIKPIIISKERQVFGDFLLMNSLKTMLTSSCNVTIVRITTWESAGVVSVTITAVGLC